MTGKRVSDRAALDSNEIDGSEYLPVVRSGQTFKAKISSIISNAARVAMEIVGALGVEGQVLAIKADRSGVEWQTVPGISIEPMANLAAFPNPGLINIRYKDLSNAKIYQWTGAGTGSGPGSGYTEVSASLALGETSASAYRGDLGKEASLRSSKAPKIVPSPDGDNNNYVSNFSDSIDGWALQHESTGTLSIIDGVLRFSRVAAGYISRAQAIESGDKAYFYFRVTGTPPDNYLTIRGLSSGHSSFVPFELGEITYAELDSPPETSSSVIIWAGSGYTGSEAYLLEIFGITIGDGSYSNHGLSRLIFDKLQNNEFVRAHDAAIAYSGNAPVPNGVGNVYLSNFETGIDSFYASNANGSLTVENGELVLTRSGACYFGKAVAVLARQKLSIRFKVTGSPISNILAIRSLSLGATQFIPFVLGEETTIQLDKPLPTTSDLLFWAGDSYSGSESYVIRIYGLSVGDGSFKPRQLLQKASDEANRRPSLDGLALTHQYAIVGREYNLYFDNLLAEDASDYYWDVACSIGKQENDRFTVIPSAPGIQSLAIYAYDKKTYSLVYYWKGYLYIADSTKTATAPKLCLIGDSTTANGVVAEEISALFAADSYMDIELIGTKGTAPALHEGISGWRLSQFAGNLSPFWDGSAINFAWYISHNSLSGCTLAIINLGINDVFNYTDDATLESAIGTMLADLETLISSMQAYNASIKIGIALTTPPSRYQDAFGNSYGAEQTRRRFKRNLAIWWKRLYLQVRNRTNIIIVPYNACLDTINNMQYGSAVPVNSRNTGVTITKQNNGVHPASSGYYQVADALYAMIKYVI